VSKLVSCEKFEKAAFLDCAIFIRDVTKRNTLSHMATTIKNLVTSFSKDQILTLREWFIKPLNVITHQRENHLYSFLMTPTSLRSIRRTPESAPGEVHRLLSRTAAGTINRAYNSLAMFNTGTIAWGDINPSFFILYKQGFLCSNCEIKIAGSWRSSSQRSLRLTAQ